MHPSTRLPDGHLRPDGWLGKKDTRRSWRVKSISNVSAGMTMVGNEASASGIVGDGDTSTTTASTTEEAPGSVHMFHVDMLPSSGRGLGGDIAGMYQKAKNHRSSNKIPEVVRPVVVPSTKEQVEKDKNPSTTLDGSSIHSMLTEDSRSRVADAREMWNSMGSLDYQHIPNKSSEKSLLLNDSSCSSIGVSSAVEMWNNIEGSIGHVTASPTRQVAKSNDRASRIENLMVQVDTPVVINVGQPPQGHTSKKWNESKNKAVPEKKDHLHAPTIPRHSDRSTTAESVPELEMSLTSLDMSLESGDYHDSDRDKMWKIAGSTTRPDEMLPLRPPTAVQKRNGYGGRKSIPSSSTTQHGFRALNRPDDWLGSRAKSKRSWTVKRIIESDLEASAENPGTTLLGDD
jgi:hypothetical protein